MGGARGAHGDTDGTGPDGTRRDGTHREAQAPSGCQSQGTMRWPGAVTLWGALWLWVPLAGGRPVRLEKVRVDTRNLTRTLSTRIQQLQLFPLGLRIRGLEPLPGEGAPEGLGAMSQRLRLFQRLLAQLPAPANAPLAQLANDLENLGSLLGAMAAQLGCPPTPDPPPLWTGPPPGPALAEAPHTAAGLVLGRLRSCLEGIAAQLEGHPPC